MSRKVKKGEREVKKKPDIWFLSLEPGSGTRSNIYTLPNIK